MSWFTKVEEKGLDAILGVFQVAKNELEQFIGDNQVKLDKLNDELIDRTRNHSKAQSALSQINKIVGE